MSLRQSIHPQPKLTVPKLRVKVSAPAMDINKSSLTPAQTVLLHKDYKKALQFCKAWCSNYERIWMTCVFVWKSWTGRGHNSCKCFQHCMECATPQMWNQMQQGMNSRSWYQLRTGFRRRKQHQTRLQRSTPPPWTRGHITSLQPELHRCLSAWSAGCLDSIFPLVAFSYILSGLTYVSLSRNVNRFPPWGDVTFVVRRCPMTGILILWFSTY
jgi:hypothetical protein